MGDAAESKAAWLIVAILRGDVSGVEAQVARIGICVGGRRPEVAARTSNDEITTAPVEKARHHNRKREAAESSGRKGARKERAVSRIYPLQVLPSII